MGGDIQIHLDKMRVRGASCSRDALHAPWKVHVSATPQRASFVLVLSGDTLLRIGGSRKDLHLCAGDIALLPDGRAYCYADDGAPQANILHGQFRFSADTPAILLSRLPDVIVERNGNDCRTHKLGLIVEMLRAEIGEQSQPQLSMLNRLTEILCLHTVQNWFSRTAGQGAALQAFAPPARLKGVIDIIHAKPDSPWTVKSLARVYGQSRTAFAAHFKTATGLSPISYVRRCRISRACRMLERTRLPLIEVAFQSGYADANAFNRAFRRETGASPGAYRRFPQR
ncbi:helix-turn-helix domain-containing protein [Litoreibacter albidus]